MYGKPPLMITSFEEVEFTEFMHYQYLPLWIPDANEEYMVYPPNVEFLRRMVETAVRDYIDVEWRGEPVYVYLTARHGFASPGNPLNRPGWHCDGFGTDDINYVWSDGPGTRYALQSFSNISDDHFVSLEQFEEQIQPDKVTPYPERSLVKLDPYVVHSTPEIDPPGCMRSFVKISISKHKYNLIGNSHNYLLDYNWEMYPRDILRNDPSKAGRDFV